MTSRAGALAVLAVVAVAACGEPGVLLPDGGSGEGGGASSGGGAANAGGGNANVGGGRVASVGGGGGATGGGGSATGGGDSAGGGSAGGGSAAGGGAGQDAGPRDAGPQLVLSPSELIFSGVKGTTSAAQVATVSNVGGTTAAPSAFSLTGDPDFTVAPRPPGSFTLDAGTQLAFSVRFTPDAGTVGVRSARLRIGDGGVALFGLATNGEQGNNEPSLQSCFDALGLAIDAGSRNLIIGTGAQPVGDEVILRLFHSADGGAVGLRPLARYSPNETLPFGWYRPLGDGGVELHGVGTIALGQEQTLNPGLVPDSGSSFEPLGAGFGVYVHSNTFGRDTFTEDGRNTGPTVHACRVYPVRDRFGAPVPHSYVLAFEDAANGDYQDYVFLLSNAKP